jgi:replicative DNA helicase
MVNNKSRVIDTMLEQDLIAYLLENSHNTTEVSKIITYETFEDTLFKASFSSMVELSLEKGVFTRFDVFRALKSKEKELNINSSNLLSIMPTRAIDYNQVAFELKELQSKRKIYELAINLVSAIESDQEVSIMTTTIENSLIDIVDASASKEICAIEQVYDEVIANMEISAGSQKVFSGIDTGSRKLNYALGGWQEGMSVIAARPSMGKTVVGLDVAKSCAKSGEKCLYVSLEMPKESLIYRYISSEAFEYNYSDLKANRISLIDVENIKKSRAKELRSLPIYFYDQDNRDVNYLSMMITAEVRKNNLKMVVIDYLQLIGDNQIKGQDDFSQVSRVSNKIQRLSRKLGIPIICLSQLSRAVESRPNKQPMLSDLRNSGNIEQDAIVVIGLYRDDYYKYVEAKANNQPVAPMDNTLKFIILKNRDGEVGDINRFVDVKTNRVADTEEELFRFSTPQVAYENSAINKIKSDFDTNVDLKPF